MSEKRKRQAELGASRPAAISSQRGVERTTARRARREGHRGVVPVVQQRLAAPGRDLCGSVHEFEFFQWLRRGGDRQFAQQRAPSKASAG